MAAAQPSAAVAAAPDATNALRWSGFVDKKAFKSILKQSWKKRWLIFDPVAFDLKWADSQAAAEAKKFKGEGFKLDPETYFAASSEEHMKPNEIKIESGKEGPTRKFLCLSFSDEAESKVLMARMHQARNYKVASIEADDSYTSTDKFKADPTGMAPGEAPGKRVFAWGVGALLCSKDGVKGMAVPKRVFDIATQPGVKMLSAGPEHVGCVEVGTAGDTARLWGSNEFAQLGLSAATHMAVSPIQLKASGNPLLKVSMVACGGSHTLAIIGGQLFTWGTGTVGQLGLSRDIQMQDTPMRVETLPAGADGRQQEVTAVYAGLVSSACLTATGDCCLWGDASQGRLGLPSSKAPGSGVPQFVNDEVEWLPKKIQLGHAEIGQPAGVTPHVVHVALGGSFTLFLLWAAGKGPGCYLLVAGCLGIDITRDTYGYSADTLEAKVIDGMIDDEMRRVPPQAGQKPRAIGPIGFDPVVLGAFAGARVAGIVAFRMSTTGQTCMAMTAGKGWLGHAGGVDTVLLDQPSISQEFMPVGGSVLGQPIVELGIGHSHAVARTATGTLFAWGRGDSGELGHGNLSDRSMPVRVLDAPGQGGSHYTSVASGSYYTVAVSEPGFMPVGGNKQAEQVKDDLAERWAAVAAAQIASHALHAPKAGAAAAKSADTDKPPAMAAAAAAGAAAAGTSSVKKPAPGGASKADAEADAKKRAKVDFDAGELPPGFNWESTDDGEIYYEQPDGETVWDDPRDKWESFWPWYLKK